MRSIIIAIVALTLTACYADRRDIDDGGAADTFEEADIFEEADVELEFDADLDIDAELEADVDADVDTDVDNPPPECELLDYEFSVVDEQMLIMTTEVTQELYESIMGENPSAVTEPCHLPVDSISAIDAMRFANALSESRGLPQCYDCVDWYCVPKPAFGGVISNCHGFRLLTEDEFRLAVEGSFDLEAESVFGPRDPERAEPVASRDADASGLFDVYGNAWELCHSTLAPTGYVMLGGGWGTELNQLESARQEIEMTFRSDKLGFRLMRKITD
jgi:hypothetical protein